MSQESIPPPVFFDSQGWRRLLVNAASWTSLTVVGMLIAVLVTTAIQSPVMRGITLAEAPRSLSAQLNPATSGANEPRIQAAQARTVSAWVSGRAFR